jgi:membrane protein YqaA with SNARE-associated domain
MTRLLAWIQGFALTLGGSGLFLIGYLDSSFLSFPEVNDFLLILMVSRHHDRLVYYAFMAAAGSVLGCLTLYYIARKGGEAFLRRRFRAHHVEGGLKLFQKYGLLMVVVPALLPPPAPFKIFVLLAGVVAVPVWQFTIAIAIARGIRYSAEGLLALYYGERASLFLRDHAREAGLWLSAIAIVFGLLWVRRMRRRRPAD